MSGSFRTAIAEEEQRRQETYAHQIPVLSKLITEQVRKAYYTQDNITILAECEGSLDEGPYC